MSLINIKKGKNDDEILQINIEYVCRIVNSHIARVGGVYYLNIFISMVGIGCWLGGRRGGILPTCGTSADSGRSCQQ
jgi:hypothetical protein